MYIYAPQGERLGAACFRQIKLLFCIFLIILSHIDKLLRDAIIMISGSNNVLVCLQGINENETEEQTQYKISNEMKQHISRMATLQIPRAETGKHVNVNKHVTRNEVEEDVTRNEVGENVTRNEVEKDATRNEVGENVTRNEVEKDATRNGEMQHITQSGTTQCTSRNLFDGVTTGHSCDEIIDINISGKLFQTYSKTLDKFPNSLLGNYEKRQKYMNKDTGELYFNRHRQSFEYILYYYQSKGLMECPTNIPLNIFIREIDFFEIGHSVIEQFEISNGIKEEPIVIDLPESMRIRTLWNLLEYPDSSRPAQVFGMLSATMILSSVVLLVMSTLPEYSQKSVNVLQLVNKHEAWMFTVDTAIVSWFTTEFLLRIVCCPNKFNFCVNYGNIIDFLSILPYYASYAIESSHNECLSILSVFRVFRVFKLTRHSPGFQIIVKAVKASFKEFMLVGVFLSIMIFIFGSIVYYVEHQLEGTKFISIPHSAWWAIVSLTTTGYGDMVPRSILGKFVGCFTVVCGVFMVALPVPSMVSHFSHFYTIEEYRKKKKNEAKKSHMKDKIYKSCISCSA